MFIYGLLDFVYSAVFQGCFLLKSSHKLNVKVVPLLVKYLMRLFSCDFFAVVEQKVLRFLGFCRLDPRFISTFIKQSWVRSHNFFQFFRADSELHQCFGLKNLLKRKFTSSAPLDCISWNLLCIASFYLAVSAYDYLFSVISLIFSFLRLVLL